jgi:hypothetical protein
LEGSDGFQWVLRRDLHNQNGLVTANDSNAS